MTYAKTLYRIDQIWYDIHTHEFLGDMAHTFQEADETICDNLQTITDTIRQSLHALINDGTDNLHPSDQIRIAVLQTTTGTLTIDDDDDPTQYRLSDYTPEDWQNLVLFPNCTATYAGIVHMRTDLPTEYLFF